MSDPTPAAVDGSSTAPTATTIEPWEKNFLRVIVAAILLSLWYWLHLQTRVHSFTLHYFDGGIAAAVVLAWGYVQKAAQRVDEGLLKKGALLIKVALGWRYLHWILNGLILVALLLFGITRSVYLQYAGDSKVQTPYRVTLRDHGVDYGPLPQLYVDGSNGPRTAGDYFFLRPSNWSVPTLNFVVESPSGVKAPPPAWFCWGRPLRLSVPDDFAKVDVHLLRVIPGPELYESLGNVEDKKGELGQIYYLRVREKSTDTVVAYVEDWRKTTFLTGSADDYLHVDKPDTSLHDEVKKAFSETKAAAVESKLSSTPPARLSLPKPFPNHYLVVLEVGRADEKDPLVSMEREVVDALTNVVIDIARKPAVTATVDGVSRAHGE